jgi:hypothetical protein
MIFSIKVVQRLPMNIISSRIGFCRLLSVSKIWQKGTKPERLKKHAKITTHQESMIAWIRSKGTKMKQSSLVTIEETKGR